MDNGKAPRPQWWSRPGQDGEPPRQPVPLDKRPAAEPPHEHGSAPEVPPGEPVPGNPYAAPDTPWAVPPPPAGPPAGRDPWAAPAPGPYPAPLSAGAAPSGRRLLTAVLLAALLAGGIGGLAGAYLQREGAGGTISLPQAPPGSTVRARGTVAGIAAAALPGVVYIHVKGGGEEGTGTGVVLDTAGHILTNNHVVAPAAGGGDISVTFNGGAVRKASVVGRDAGYDLAVVKVSGVSGLQPLPLGNSDSVRVGDPVVAIGAPYDLEGTVTSGIISAKDRPISAGGDSGGGQGSTGDVSYVDALQTDAPINPGNSGGPLMNVQGQVIGINSAIRSADSGLGDTGSQGGSIGLGFAIPVNQARRVAEELINTGRATHPVIGVTIDMGWSGDGARIAASAGGGSPAVTPGGPGDRAGLAPGDVITALDGRPVHTGQELVVRVRSHVPGDHIRLTVRHDGSERSVELVLGSSTGG